MVAIPCWGKRKKEVNALLNFEIDDLTLFNRTEKERNQNEVLCQNIELRRTTVSIISCNTCAI